MPSSPSISFSLTERIIIDPVLGMRAPPSPQEAQQSPNFRGKIWNVFESEILARVASIFTSVFAAADAFAHLTFALYKEAYFISRSICHLTPATWNSAEICGHFQRAASFFKLTFIGSLIGFISPGALKQFRYSPSAPSSEDENIAFDINTPEALRELANRVTKAQVPIDELLQFWKESPLENRDRFVSLFSRTGFRDIRINLAQAVYRPITMGKSVQWLSRPEVDQKINSIKDNAFNQAFFFHTTPNEKTLESILRSKKVEVRHEKAFRGAFVSTQPEEFGRYILAFRKNIERLSKLEHGFYIGSSAYWAGFSRDIPVTDTTLAYIILANGDANECEKLKNQCQQWTNRSINVISLSDAERTLNAVQQLGMGIPIEWPEEDEGTADKILNTLKARTSETLSVQQTTATQHVPQKQAQMMAYAN